MCSPSHDMIMCLVVARNKNHGCRVQAQEMSVSANWGVLFVGVQKIGALVFGVYTSAPGFWKLPNPASMGARAA